jgi:hypothetical protein
VPEDLVVWVKGGLRCLAATISPPEGLPEVIKLQDQPPNGMLLSKRVAESIIPPPQLRRELLWVLLLAASDRKFVKNPWRVLMDSWGDMSAVMSSDIEAGLGLALSLGSFEAGLGVFEMGLTARRFPISFLCVSEICLLRALCDPNGGY